MDDKKETTTTEDAGIQPEADSALDRTVAAAERLEAANEAEEKIVARKEELVNQAMIAGKAEAGTPPPKKEKLSDEAYADALIAGEVNPLKEDGFID